MTVIVFVIDIVSFEKKEGGEHAITVAEWDVVIINIISIFNICIIFRIIFIIIIMTANTNYT